MEYNYLIEEIKKGIDPQREDLLLKLDDLKKMIDSHRNLVHAIKDVLSLICKHN
jgi:hypothetical protein